MNSGLTTKEKESDQQTLARYREQIKTLFDKIKHGDQAHQDWLKTAIDEHFSGVIGG